MYQYFVPQNLQDFDLCISCYKAVPHSHPMREVGMGLELVETEQDPTNQKELKEQAKIGVEKMESSLIHAIQCHNIHCNDKYCIWMKRMLTHTRECKLMASGEYHMCIICSNFRSVCMFHTKNCRMDNCTVPCCEVIKKYLRHQLNQSQVHVQQNVAQTNSVQNNTAIAICPNNQVTRPVSVGKGNPRDLIATRQQGKSNLAARTTSSNMPQNFPAVVPSRVGKHGVAEINATVPQELPIRSLQTPQVIGMSGPYPSMNNISNVHNLTQEHLTLQHIVAQRYHQLQQQSYLRWQQELQQQQQQQHAIIWQQQQQQYFTAMNQMSPIFATQQHSSELVVTHFTPQYSQFSQQPGWGQTYILPHLPISRINVPPQSTPQYSQQVYRAHGKPRPIIHLEQPLSSRPTNIPANTGARSPPR